MVLAIISIAVVLVIVVVSSLYSRQREKRLEGFSGLTREGFSEYFARQGVAPHISKVVYDIFKDKVRSQGFRPSPEMHIERVFEQLEEDTDDDALEILKALEIPTPSETILERWQHGKVETISDLVLWTDWISRNVDRPNVQCD